MSVQFMVCGIIALSREWKERDKAFSLTSPLLPVAYGGHLYKSA
jgi:hypothetical protein